MYATIFLLLGGVFFWLAFKGYSSGEIMARGWGVEVRIYRQADEPVRFWLTFWLYVALTLVAFTLAILLVRR